MGAGASSFRNKKFGRSTLFLVRVFYGDKIIGEIAAAGVCVLLIGFPASQLLLSLAAHSPRHQRRDAF